MKRRIIAIITAICLVISTTTVSVNAYTKENDEKVKETILSALYLMEEMFQSQYEQSEEKFKNDISKGHYSYELSMETFEEEDLLSNVKYLDYLSTYMAAKAYAKENKKGLLQITQINFFKYITHEYKEEEYIPTEIPKYIQDDYILDEYHKIGTEFITEPKKIPIYEQIENGRYKKTGEELFTPNTQNTKYIGYGTSIITPDEMLVQLGINKKDIKEEIQNRKKTIEGYINEESVKQLIRLRLPILQQVSDYSYLYRGKTTEERERLIDTAMSLLGKVPYDFGGKPSHAGYDNTWWTFKSDGKQKGLDCSGYVNWVFMTAGINEETTKLAQTARSLRENNAPQVTKDELIPGDIGALYRSSGINHIGIYIGEGKWIHCSSAAKTVVVSDTMSFTHFYRVLDPGEFVTPESALEISTETKAEDKNIDLEKQNSKDENFTNEYKIPNNIDINNSLYYTQNYNTPKYTQEEVYLLAQLIDHESRYEGLNGWIGVGEVVLNRINSPLFPNTLREVVYQKGQFSGNSQIKNMKPSEDIIRTADLILNSTLRIFNDATVMYFRNPKITSNIPADKPVDWGRYKYVMNINHHAFYAQPT